MTHPIYCYKGTRLKDMTTPYLLDELGKLETTFFFRLHTAMIEELNQRGIEFDADAKAPAANKADTNLMLKAAFARISKLEARFASLQSAVIDGPLPQGAKKTPKRRKK